MARQKSIKGLGRDIYFQKTEEDKQVKQFTDKQVKQQYPFVRATFYIRPEQQDQLDELKIKLRSKLREQGAGKVYKVDKSELIRLAIDLLNKQGEDLLIKLLTDKTTY